VWVQEDSFTGTVTRASSLNRYAYVEGSPVSHTDVLGAFRAASAMAAQKLSAADYAEFMKWFAILSVVGRYNEWQANLAVVRQAAADEEYYRAVAGLPMPGEEYQNRGFWGNAGAFISGWTGQAWHAGVGAFDLALVGVGGTSGWAQYTGSAERVDQMYESFMFGVEENGWWAQSNIAFNPVYHLIAAGDSVMQACGVGEWNQCGSSTFDFQMAEAEVALIAYGGAKSISVKLPGAKSPVVLTGEAATDSGAVGGLRAAGANSVEILREPAALKGLTPSQIDDLAVNAGYDVLPGKVSASNPATRYYVPGTNRSVGFRVLPGGVAGQTGIKAGPYLKFFGGPNDSLRVPLSAS